MEVRGIQGRLIDLMRASWERYMKIELISPERKRELDAWYQGFLTRR